MSLLSKNGLTKALTRMTSKKHDQANPFGKGLEFRAVVVMACDDEIIPSQERIQNVGDDGDLQEVYDTERQLLYVACTRARDLLFITSSSEASEFLDDLRMGNV